MPAHDILVQRSNVLIDHTRFLTLASRGPEGVWASTVNFVPLRQPLRFLWYSLRDTRHSRNIDAFPEVAGSVFRTDLPTDLGLDGAQFTGTARSVEPDGPEEFHKLFYERNFPDEQTREEWRIPLDEFRGNGPRRFYLLTITAWWLVDLDRWLVTKDDRRIAVDLAALSSIPPSHDDMRSSTGSDQIRVIATSSLVRDF
jgi:uncharacterized protein YhbP (UPF0306 family)